MLLKAPLARTFFLVVMFTLVATASGIETGRNSALEDRRVLCLARAVTILAAATPAPAPSISSTSTPGEEIPVGPFEKLLRWKTFALWLGIVILSIFCGVLYRSEKRWVKIIREIINTVPGVEPLATKIGGFLGPKKAVEMGLPQAVRELKASEGRLEGNLAGPHFPIAAVFEERCSRVLLLGTGGQGKTSMISNWMSFAEGDSGGPDPMVSTGKIALYSMSIVRRTKGRGFIWHLEVDDYRGQNASEFITELAAESAGWHNRGSGSPAASLGVQPLRLRPPINAIVLMCDLFKTERQPGEPLDTRPRDQPNTARINRHLADWNEAWLDLWWEIAGEHVKLICLFINKVDLLPDYDRKFRSKVLHQFDALIGRLNRRDVRLEIIHGSALSGRGMPELTKLLATYADECDTAS